MLHDSTLREDGAYGVAVLWSFALGEALAFLRIAATLVVAVTFAVAAEPNWPWWFTLAVTLTIAPSLGWAHTREDLLDNLARVRFLPVAAVAHHLLRVARRASFSLAGILETIVPLVLAFAVGSSLGPVSESPSGYLVGACMVTLYSVTGTAQWLVDSANYLPAQAHPLWFVRLNRLVAPGLLAAIYAFLLSPNAHSPMSVVPILVAVAFLSLYAFPPLYEKLLTRARLQSRRDVDAAQSVAASTIHSYFSPPLFFLAIAARTGSAERLLGTLEDLRTMVHNCMNEVMHGTPGGSMGDLFNDFRRLLPEQVGERLDIDPASEAMKLPGPDFAVARRVLVDLCSNALKSGWPKKMSTTVQVRARQVTDENYQVRYEITVRDNGPGFNREIDSDSSLALLDRTLQPFRGRLCFDSPGPGGTTVTAIWDKSKG